MAKGLKEGAGATTALLITFVALWLVSTVLLVTLYTGQAELKDATARARENAARLISPSEEKSIPLFQQAKAGGPTVAGLLEGARGRTAELATGEKADDPGAVRTKLDTLLGTIRSDNIVPDADRFESVSYHQALTMLYAGFNTEHTRMTEATNRVAELESEVDRLVKAAADQRTDFDRRAKELGDQLAAAEAERAKYREERDQHIAKIEGDFEKARTLQETDLTKERQTTTELRKRLGKMENRLAAYTDKLGEVLPGPAQLATAREPDGRILTALPGDPVVYIDLGRKDRLVLGLQFAVYSSEGGIPERGKSKATIRVVAIEPASAACEILRVADGQVILPGDLVANPIYRPDRAVNFVVLGEFDLEHTGVPAPEDAAVVESMITDWGGTVTREISAMTDFVVIGAAPRKPRTSPDLSPEEAARNAARQQAYDHYMSMVREANTLSIPVMSQEVFLNFLGYGTFVARR